MAAREARRLRFFDLLRQRRLLPEQTNYRKWRDDRIFTWDGNRTLDEFWHRPDGRTVHVVSDCRGDGGVTFLFDDVTERFSLERQYHGLIESQRETLDHLNEGIAVFGADGCLQLSSGFPNHLAFAGRSTSGTAAFGSSHCPKRSSGARTAVLANASGCDNGHA